MRAIPLFPEGLKICRTEFLSSKFITRDQSPLWLFYRGDCVATLKWFLFAHWLSDSLWLWTMQLDGLLEFDGLRQHYAMDTYTM